MRLLVCTNLGMDLPVATRRDAVVHAACLRAPWLPSVLEHACVGMDGMMECAEWVVAHGCRVPPTVQRFLQASDIGSPSAAASSIPTDGGEETPWGDVGARALDSEVGAGQVVVWGDALQGSAACRDGVSPWQLWASVITCITVLFIVGIILVIQRHHQRSDPEWSRAWRGETSGATATQPVVR
jgi:hypothetical protein